jgi:hypothetical protein
VLTLLCVLGIGLAYDVAGSAAELAAPSTPDFALGVSPAGQSVQQSQSATFAVTATAKGAFTGGVSLTATGRPTGTTATFTPAAITLSTSASSGTATLTVTTATSTPVGSYSVTITGASGKLSHSVSVGLTVNRAVAPSLALSVTPSTVTVPAGSTGTYQVAIGRTNITVPVNLAVIGSLPAGISPSLSPNPTTGNSSTLLLTTAATTPDGTYTVYLVGWATVGGSTKYAYAQTQLVVSTPKGKSFTISGSLRGTLAPGAPPLPLDLTLANPNNQKLTISNLTVTVGGTSAGAACGPTNFTVTQYSGKFPLNMAARQTASLSQLGAAASALPTVGMRDLPTNQDACKGVTVDLVYSGTGQGA